MDTTNPLFTETGSWAVSHDTELNCRRAASTDLLTALPKDDVPRELSCTWTPEIGAVLRAHATAIFRSFPHPGLAADVRGTRIRAAEPRPTVGLPRNRAMMKRVCNFRRFVLDSTPFPGGVD